MIWLEVICENCVSVYKKTWCPNEVHEKLHLWKIMYRSKHLYLHIYDSSKTLCMPAVCLTVLYRSKICVIRNFHCHLLYQKDAGTRVSHDHSVGEWTSTHTHTKIRGYNSVIHEWSLIPYSVANLYIFVPYSQCSTLWAFPSKWLIQVINKYAVESCWTL